MNLETISEKLGKVSSIISYAGCFSLLVMMCLTAADVVGRYLFNTPIVGVFELTEFMVLILIFSFLAYTQFHKSHVSVDLLVMRFPARIRLYIELFNHGVCLVLMALITWMGLEKALELKEVGEASPNLGIPDYPFVFFLAFGCAVMCIEYIRDLLQLFLGRKEPTKS